VIQLDRRQQLIVLLLVGVILFSGGYRLAQIKDKSTEKLKPALESSDENKAKEVTVHVFGAVSKPGVYQVSQSARVIDAINMAGPTGEADLDSIKLAAKVTDGQDISVPFKADIDPAATGVTQGASTSAGRNVFTAPTGAKSGGAVAANGLVNINTANQSELDTLPGIGPALAQRIIQYRETNGYFQSVEDLKNVSGIGDKNFENMKDKITVR
jgi:competence protein ComEA